MSTNTPVVRYRLYEDGKPITYEIEGGCFEVVGKSLELLADEMCTYFEVLNFKDLNVTVDIEGIFSYNGKIYEIRKEELKTSSLLGFEARRFNDHVNAT